MKLRLFYFFISGIIIISIFTGIIIWRNKHFKQIPKFDEQSFNAPVSSKYIPKNSDLVFHWKLNPNVLPKYIENFQDKTSKQSINKKISYIRDSSLKLMSLDFGKDVSKWVGDYGSFAILNSKKHPLHGWIMILGKKNDVNIENELESFSSSNIVYENNNHSNKLNISKTEIISREINSNNSIYFANEKDHLLISSNPKIIQSSMEELDSNKSNTKEKYKKIQLKDNLKDGLLLLEMSPRKLSNISEKY